MWSQAVARTELSKILATRKWDEVDGLWMQVGCYTANTMELEAGIARDKLKPLRGRRLERRSHSDAARWQRGRGCQRHLCAPWGAPRISYASPPYSGGLALKLAVQKLDGKDIPSPHDPAAAARDQRDDQALPGGDLGRDEGRLQRLQSVARVQSRAGSPRSSPQTHPRSACRPPWSASQKCDGRVRGRAMTGRLPSRASTNLRSPRRPDPATGAHSP